MNTCPQCGTPLGEVPPKFCPTCGVEILPGETNTVSGEAVFFAGDLSRKEMKKLAKERLSGNWGKAIGAGLLASLILLGGSALGIGIGGIILAGVLDMGLALFFMQLFRIREVPFNKMFSGFERFGTACWAGILQGLLLFAWSLLLVIPGIIKYYAYAMTFYILNDHPEMTAREAITASKKMMKGHKGRLFVLELSFIGWALLSSLTGGILLIVYVYPYQCATYAAFYEDLKARQED
ncbi:MAG: DUF975 family protein [Bacillota bacterium]|nr:DUF975 family protein [Bacillota bacterium]